MVIELLALSLSLAASTWTVDAGGGGDFTTIQAAIDAAAAGDVLLVQQGSYDGFRLDKSLTLLAASAGVTPKIEGTSIVRGADRVVVRGLDFRRLEVREIGAGFMARDMIAGFGSFLDEPKGLLIQDAHAALVSHAEIHGESDGNGSDGVTLGESSATFVRIEAFGGAGLDCIFSQGHAGPAVQLLSGANARFERCSLQGGWTDIGGIGTCSGSTGAGLKTSAPALARLVGSADDTVKGGDFLTGGSSPGFCIDAKPGAPVFVSGGTLGPDVPFGPVTIVPEQRPHLLIEGTGALGSPMQVIVEGPPGASGQILVGAELAAISLPSWDGELSIDPESLLAVVPVTLDAGTGQAIIPFAIPADPSALARVLIVQAAFPGVPGLVDPAKKYLTGADAVIISP